MLTAQPAAAFGFARAGALPCALRTHGAWPELKGHELSLLGGRLLAFDEASARYSLWAYDADVSGRGDPLRMAEGPLEAGSWQRKLGGGEARHHALVDLGVADVLLQRAPANGTYGLWSAARLAGAEVGTHPMAGGDCERGACLPAASMDSPGAPPTMAPTRRTTLAPA